MLGISYLVYGCFVGRLGTLGTQSELLLLEVILKNEQLSMTLSIYILSLLCHDKAVNVENSFRCCTGGLEALFGIEKAEN